MIYGDQQLKEIETIRERTLKVALSDADVKRLAMKAAAGGVLVEQLLQSFIGDLVSGTYSNGSDERMYAEQWFDRCWFGSYAPTSSLLQHLSRNGCIDHALELQEKLQDYQDDMKDEELTRQERNEIRQEARETQKEIAELFGKYTNPEDWQKVIIWKERLDQMLEENES